MLLGGRVIQRVSATRAFAKTAPHVLPALDRVVHRLTGGKVVPSAWVLPSVILTTTGAKTGRRRRTPVACMPGSEDGFVLVGSNFGRPEHPSWTANLLVHPDAVINWKGRDIPVHARLLEGKEREVAWSAVLDFWPPYETYQARAKRQIRLFRLERR